MNESTLFRVVYPARATRDQVLVTPALAKYLLDNFNDRNRPISKATVDSYAKDMRDGAWRDNGDRVRFDRNGRMIDGQHRLDSIVESGVNQRVDFIFGLDPEVIGTIDHNRPRRIGDDLNIKFGTKNGAVVAARARWVKLLVNPHREKMTTNTTENIVREFEDGFKVVNRLCPTSRGVYTAPVMAAFVLGAQAFPNKVRDMLRKLIEGEADSVASKKLVAYLAIGGGNDNDDMRARKTLYAIWAHLNNHEFERLQAVHCTRMVEEVIDAIERRVGAPVRSVEMSKA